MEYVVEQRTSTWIRTTVEADNYDQAIELADEKFAEGHYNEVPETFELMDEYYVFDGLTAKLIGGN